MAGSVGQFSLWTAANQSPPRSTCREAACLRPNAAIAWTTGHPQVPLGPDHAEQSPIQRIHQTLRMEGLAASIDKAADAVLLGFRNMLAVQFFEPPWHATGRLFVVQASPNDIPEVHFPAGHPASRASGLRWCRMPSKRSASFSETKSHLLMTMTLANSI